MRNLIREILKEDLKNWGVSDATKDKYKMSPLKEDIPVHMDISPVKKIWEKHGINETEIQEQIQLRKEGYLEQALFADEEEQQNKKVDMKDCWREKYKMS